MAAFGPQVLDGDEPRWTRVMLDGQSQFGGTAAFTAQTRNVAGRVMFSGGWDSDRAPAGRRTRMVRTQALLAQRQPASIARVQRGSSPSRTCGPKAAIVAARQMLQQARQAQHDRTSGRSTTKRV